jgi:sugar phosphate isomerase/epimerase
MVKQLGVEYVDIKEFHLPQTDSIKDLMAGRKKFDDAKLKVIGGGNVSLKETTEAGMRPHFEYARACGFPMMICAPSLASLPVAEKLAVEYNIKLALHNHGPEDKEFPAPRDVMAAVKNMSPLVGLCIDIGHTVRAGQDVVEAIIAAGPRLFELHMKDLTDYKTARSQVAVGEGIIPIPAIFRQLIKQSYQGVCSLEYEINEFDPLPGMQQSFSYMRGVLAGLKS